MTALIIGASAGLGRALATELAKSGTDLVICASNSDDLKAIASDLMLKYNINVITIIADAANPVNFSNSIYEICKNVHTLNELYFPIGRSIDRDDGLTDPQLIANIIAINLVSIMSLISLLSPILIHKNTGLIIGFGSIAAARGRSNNIAYSAAKRGLKSYFESLRHSLSKFNIKVQFYEMGYLKTQLSFGKKLPLPPASPGNIAKIILSQRNNDFGSMYLPRYWKYISFTLNLLPWAIYKHLNF